MISRFSRREIPHKTIWMFWQTGFATAPDLVQLCVQSWKRHNPDWELRLLDQNDLADLVGSDHFLVSGRPDLPVQKVADGARLWLLDRHGGVWADATCFCRRPLDDWLPRYASSGFFAFRNPGPDRLIASWFLYSDRRHVLIDRFKREFFSLWKDNFFSELNTRSGKITADLIYKEMRSNALSSSHWRTIAPRIETYPYFILHYVFGWLVHNDKRFGKLWERVRHLDVSTARAHMIGTLIRAECTDADRYASEMKARRTPMFKLNWRYEKLPQWQILKPLLQETL